MSENPLLELQKVGQSPWCDYIHRTGLLSGEIRQMYDDGEILGITSNPTIFDKAISGTQDYDGAIRAYLQKEPECDVNSLYEALVIEDIRIAADMMKPAYEKSDRIDGYINVEVSPMLAYDTDATIEEARRLFSTIGRPNVMIKVPGTKEGFPAIATLIGEGINVNVTLVFFLEQYNNAVEAYFTGLEKLAEKGGDLSKVASAASFFISRIDTSVDKQLPDKSPLRGKIAVSCGKVAYARFKEIAASERFAALKEKGALTQRLLWASTGTKNPDYSDVLYVEEMIGPDTINTIPPATLNIFRDHGRVRMSLTEESGEAQSNLAELKNLGIDIDDVLRKLLEDGVIAFEKSFNSLLEALARKKEELL